MTDLKFKGLKNNLAFRNHRKVIQHLKLSSGPSSVSKHIRYWNILYMVF